MDNNKNYMMLSDEQEFMDAIFNNDIVITQTYASSNNSGLHTYIKGNNQNFNSSTDFNISLPKNNYMLMNSAYFKFEIDITTTPNSNATENSTFLIPNFILNLLNTINISSEDFSYTNSNFNNGRSLATLINIIKARSYTPNQMMLVSLLENMTFSVSDSNNNTIDLNKGLCIAKPYNAGEITDKKTRYYINVPIDMLLPISDKIKFMSGALQLNLNFAYQTNFITSGEPINDFTTGFTPIPLATVAELTINSIVLHYPAIRSFNDNFVNNNTIQKLSGINVKRHVLNTTTVNANTKSAGKVLATLNSSGSISSTGKPLQMIIIPRIASCTKGSVANTIAPNINAEIPDSSIATLICADNVVGNNQNYILNGLMYVSELIVKSPSGVVYPSNRTQLLSGSSFSDSFNYLNSFIQVQGFDPSGRNSNSCLSFNQYKNYQKALVVDLTNSTTSSVNNNTSFDVSFNINAIDQFQVVTSGDPPTAGDVNYVFDGEIYIVSMNVI